MYVPLNHGVFMNRTQIYLEVSQQKALRSMATERSTTISELIREAIEAMISRYQKPKSDPLDGIVSLYSNSEDREGSTRHDDLYDL